MAHRDSFSDALRDRLLFAALGALPAMGCGETKVPTPPIGPAETSTVTLEPPPPTTVELTPPIPPTPPTESPIAVTPPNVAPELPPNCYTPFSTMRSVGTGEPASPPPPSAFDKNGCLPSKLVTNGCCNGATGGPKFDKGNCCYTIPTGPCCGRPLVIEGRAEIPEVISTPGWARVAPSSQTPDMDSVLDADTREALVRAYARDACMEHASVASFARFTLDLMAIGAPAEFVRDAGKAMLDEVAHAELCFALASRFSGSALGPAPFPAAAASGTRSFEDVVVAAVTEGCVGETLAAYVASRRLALAEDEAARDALARIREDEARHAELAWRFVGWVIRERGVAKEEIADAMERALSALELPSGSEGDAGNQDSLARMGVLTPSAEAMVMACGAEEILRPALRSLRAAPRAS